MKEARCAASGGTSGCITDFGCLPSRGATVSRTNALADRGLGGDAVVQGAERRAAGVVLCVGGRPASIAVTETDDATLTSPGQQSHADERSSAGNASNFTLRSFI